MLPGWSEDCCHNNCLVTSFRPWRLNHSFNKKAEGQGLVAPAGRRRPGYDRHDIVCLGLHERSSVPHRMCTTIPTYSILHVTHVFAACLALPIGPRLIRLTCRAT